VPRKGELTWEGVGGLRGMWEEYMVELCGLRGVKRIGGVGERWEGNAENLQAKIVKADFTGCVVKGKCTVSAEIGEGTRRSGANVWVILLTACSDGRS
jgi:hypothetical protein